MCTDACDGLPTTARALLAADVGRGRAAAANKRPWILHRRDAVLILVAPPPQWLHWQRPATYRLVFQAVPGTTWDGHSCINALLVDSALHAQ